MTWKEWNIQVQIFRKGQGWNLDTKIFSLSVLISVKGQGWNPEILQHLWGRQYGGWVFIRAMKSPRKTLAGIEIRMISQVPASWWLWGNDYEAGEQQQQDRCQKPPKRFYMSDEKCLDMSLISSEKFSTPFLIQSINLGRWVASIPVCRKKIFSLDKS